jgi:hypothetical protein
MNGRLPLVLRPSPSFVPVGVVGLPVPVETTGYVVAFDDEVRIWNNRPGEGTTMQWRVRARAEIEELPPLSIVAAGAVRCGTGFVITGALQDGRAVVVGSDEDGVVLWQHELDGPAPTRWPIPACIPTPVVVWQTAYGQVEIADVTASALIRRASVAVGGPPLDIAAAANSIWVVWSSESGVWAAEQDQRSRRTFQVDAAYASQLAVGSCAGGVCIAWGREQPPVLAQGDVARTKFGPAVPLDVAGVVGGALDVIPGGPPLVHVRGSALNENAELQPVSVLTAPATTPLVIEGLVHAVACRDDEVVVLGSTDLRFVKRVA